VVSFTRVPVHAAASCEHHSGSKLPAVHGFGYLLTQVARIAMVMYLMALPLALIMGVPISSVLVDTGIVVTFYSLVGGIVAVIWTDALQAFVLVGGALACLVLMLCQLPGGPGELFTIAAEHHKFSFGSMGLEDWSRQTFWVVLLNGFFVNLQNFGIDQNYVQRYIASSSEKEARKSVWLGGLLYVPVSAVFFLIGTALFAFYLSHPDDIAEVRNLVATQKLIREGLAPSAPDFVASVATKAATLGDADIGDGVFPQLSKLAQAVETPFDWSPDSKFLACSAGGRIRLIEVATGSDKALTEIRPAGEEPRYAVTFSPDGHLLSFNRLLPHPEGGTFLQIQVLVPR
jgi:SSS family solute:Na+ symporter